ncbi:MAG: hypothetical protein JSW67_14395 [Candidatus Latescibacterota bacterium]|nr:MAG: hypothetical protein JSW67_14395 [Candidatus Latescibacterota bacterium]
MDRVLDLHDFLSDAGNMRTAAVLETLAHQIAALGPDVRTEVEPFALRFRVEERVLCELSLYGELFIARVGPGLAVEYRVRSDEVALQALDVVVREYVQLRDSTAPPLA